MENGIDEFLKKNIDELLCDALKRRVFTACSVGFFKMDDDGQENTVWNYGLAGEGKSLSPVTDSTCFDLASLTKPLVTSLSLLSLLEADQLHIEDSLAKFFSCQNLNHRKITLRHLLNHSSGLPAHRPYYNGLIGIPSHLRGERVVDWILQENLLFLPGMDTLYSDLGFILLGKIIEQVAGESLDKYWRKRILQPLDLENGLFFNVHGKNDLKVYAATGECPWSKTSLCGTVHDDNCRALGGVAGHAGLFGSTNAVLSLCKNIVLNYHGRQQLPFLRPHSIKSMLTNKLGSWRFGFDTPTAQSSSGKYFSDLSIGHLGFTGTSFWIDLRRKLAIVFLSNRVLCGESAVEIKRLRPLLHDTLMRYLISHKGVTQFSPRTLQGTPFSAP